MRRILLTAALTLGFIGAAAAACPAPPRGQPLPAEAMPTVQTWPPWRVSVDALTERLRHSNVGP